MIILFKFGKLLMSNIMICESYTSHHFKYFNIDLKYFFTLFTNFKNINKVYIVNTLNIFHFIFVLYIFELLIFLIIRFS